MTVNKHQTKIMIQLYICTTIKLQSWGDFFFIFYYTKNKGSEEEKREMLEAVNLSKTA